MNAQVVAYAIGHASLRARLLSATAGFPSSDLEDARQDLLFDCVRRWSKFDTGRGDPGGFIRGVMRNHSTVLIARRSHRVCHEIFAEDFVSRESEGATDVLDLVRCGDPASALDLSLDVKRVLRQLPHHLQSLAGLLSDLPVAQVCIQIGKSRSRTYQMIREIRAAFNAAGLGRARDTASVGAKCHRRPSGPAKRVTR
jgi:hypothetical protein